jgi:2-oxoisovalerate dehydrogenase E1 component
MSNGLVEAPMVVRVGSGAVRSAGPHHSGTYHPAWAHIPGLIVCLPSTPADAKGLMKTALNARDPVLMLETKALFATKGPVPAGDHYVPFGLARIAREGTDLTIASAGQLVHRALEAAETLAAEGISVEVVDLRTIQPLDVDTVASSVRKTHRLLVVDEGYAMFGVGAELAQSINELAFDDLDGPVARLHTEPVPHPFAPALERAMLVGTDAIVAAARRAVAGHADPIRRHGRGDAAAPAPVERRVAPSKPLANPIAAPTPTVEGEPVKMPFGDLTVSEGRLLRWLAEPGSCVQAGAVLAEVETDKAVVEIEAPKAGTLGPLLAKAGDIVKMGQTIAAIR